MKIQGKFNPDRLQTPGSSDQWSRLLAAAALAGGAHPCLDEIAATLQSLDVEDAVILAGGVYYARRGRFDVAGIASDVLALADAANQFDKLKQKLPLPREVLNHSADTAQAMMLLESLADMRAIFVILAERLCALRYLKDADEPARQALANETFVLHVPIANRLGIGNLKWELEDQAFRYLAPDTYKDIAKHLEERRADREEYIKLTVAQIQTALDEVGISAEVQGRPKHIYSIWRKMQRKEKGFADLYDVRAVRILVDSLEQCYAALSVVHNLWQYIPGEYDDYIAAPKANHYQSLHTAVHGPRDKTVEIQIRTRTMHQYAENGLAAHWRYKEGAGDADGDARVDWLRNIVRQSAMYEGESPLAAPVSRVYVLSPKGKVLDLPVGATPLDYAYLVHTDLGHRCRGAKVNGKMVPLNTPLHSGQEVEIIAGKELQPSRDWLMPDAKYLVSSRARAKVRQWFKTQFRAEHIAHGKAALTRELARQRLDAVDFEAVAKHFNLAHADDLFAALGRGDLGLLQVSHVIAAPAVPPTPTPPTGHSASARPVAPPLDILGVDNLMTGIARCCKPLPGDTVRGFITKGRGVVLHRKRCKNFSRLALLHPERVVEVNWGTRETGKYDADVAVIAQDRAGLLRDVTAVITGADINVMAANTYTDRHTLQARMTLTVQVTNRAQLSAVLDKIAQVKGVLEARRME